MATPTQAPSPETLVRDLLQELKTKVEWLAITEEELDELGAFDYSAARDEWVELDEIRAAEDKERRRDSIRARFKNVVRRSLVEQWLQQHASMKQQSQRKRVLDTIQLYLRDDREDELFHYLCDVLVIGLEKADKKQTSKLRGGSFYPVLIAWAILTGLLRVGLAFGVLAVASSKFETIVFALLILIYYGVVSASAAERYYNSSTGKRSENLLMRLMLKLNHDELDWEREHRIEAEREASQNVARGAVPFLISELSIGLVWLLAMYKLVTAAFF